MNFSNLKVYYFLFQLKKLKSKNQKSSNYFRVEIFYSIILEWKYFFIQFDKQLQELNSRFNDQVIDLLSLSTTLILKDANKFFDTIRCMFRSAKKKKTFSSNKNCFKIIPHVWIKSLNRLLEKKILILSVN